MKHTNVSLAAHIASRGQFPWQVALIVENSWSCGGSLISSQWVLTAALCAGSSYEIVLGANRYDGSESGSLVVTSTTTILHPDYDGNLNNDIALIQLPSAISFTDYIKPIRLRYVASDLAGEVARVSGWGKTSEDSSGISPTLQYVDLTVITNTECADVFGSFITPSKLCTATTGGQSTCSGDGGGPLVYKESDGVYTQVGIVSFTATAGCEQGYPAGFTRVNCYLRWIDDITGIILPPCT
uniref:Trypsin-like serine protease n=1 Tax=Coptotermes formosanus TaxID=36987 RepID=R4UL29_COPFO|nr:trypsin-like serine protease [Coptotermes formosanus]